MYQELVSQIVSRASDFKRDGVTQDEMKAQMVNIKQHLQTDFSNINKTNREAIQTDMDQLLNAVEQAERMIESTFGQRYQGGAEHE